MYNNLGFLLSFLIYFISLVVADEPSLITVENPKANQVLSPNQQLMIQYTVHGVSNGELSISLLSLLTWLAVPNYPSSMDAIFKWSQPNNTIQLKASGGLETNAIAGGRDKIYIHRWKLPGCRFFKRYLPSEWSFSLVFDPNYPEPTNNISLGPRQQVITVPIGVNFNLTAMEDRHHKGCSI